MTSLSRQLKQLAAPQTSLLKLDKKKPSLLFDPKEAANLDRDAVYEIGLSGLEDLEKIDSRFTEFRNSLFSFASKSFERAVQTAEVNEKVDKHIEDFLVLVSPYFTLKSAHKALEWLVNRYHVHQFNVNAWIMCILPFHDTKIFVRAIQLVSLKNETGQWHWLHSLQKQGIPLPKHTLLNRCAIDVGLLKHICSTLQKAITVHSDKPSVLNVSVAFYTTSVVGMIELAKKVTEEQLATLLVTLLNGLSSKLPDLVAGCYMVVAQLTRKAKLTAKVAIEFVASIFKGLTPTLVVEAVTVLTLLCNNQDSPLLLVPQFRKSAEFLADHIGLVSVIGTLSSSYQVSPFVGTLINAFLQEIAQSSDSKSISNFLLKLVEDVRFKGADAGKVIQSFFTAYVKALEMAKNNGQADLNAVVKEIVTRMEVQYPIDFERSLHQFLSDNSISDARKEKVRQILGDHWDVDHTKLFMQLNHASDGVRADAVASIVKAIKENKVKNIAVAVPMLIERLSDSSPLVVRQVLMLEEALLDIFPADNQFALLLNVLNGNKVAANPEDWKEIRLVLVKLMCSAKYLQALNTDQLAEVFLSMLPFVFPMDASDFVVAKAVLRSALITYSPMLKLLSENFKQVESSRKEPPANVVHVIIGQSKAFEADDMNQKLFELLLTRIQEPLAHPSRILPAIFIVTPLLKNVANKSLANEMGTRFIGVLSRLVKIAKPNPRTECQGRLKVQTILAISQSNSILVLESLVYAAMEIFENVSVDSVAMSKLQWADLSSEKHASLRFLLSLFRFLIAGLTSRTSALFQSAMHSLFERLLDTQAKVFFLGVVWSSPDSPDQLRAVSLKMAALFIEKEIRESSWTVSFDSSVVPLLITCLVNSNNVVREHAIALFEVLCKIKALKITTYSGLVSEVTEASEEISTDLEQTKVVLSAYLSKSTSSKVCSTLFGLVCSDQVPDHVKLGLLKALQAVNTPAILTSLLPLINQLTEKTQEELDIVQSTVFTMLLERFTSKTAPILSKPEGLQTFQKVMRSSKNILTNEDNITISPQDIVIEILTKEFFLALTDQKTKMDIFNELLDIIVKTDKATTARQARRALKRIAFEANLIAKLLDFKTQAAQAPQDVKGRKSRPKPSQSPVWNRILAVLEMFQTKKKIVDVHLLISPLFDLLKCCLDEEEQLPLEYSKQVILSCLLACCQQFTPSRNAKLASEFNTGVVVQCVRVSNNPQTHHQALLLLSLAAQLFPDHVLHNIMAIFTFMGTSVLRQDDAYSFQVIAKTLESVIPTLIEASKKTAVEPVVTTVIHVFADALPQVPEHRRIPVIDKLLTTLDPEVYLWLAPTLILSNMATQGPRLGRGLAKEEDDKDRVAPDVEFSLNICHLYKPQVQLKACSRMLEYLQSLPVEKDDKRRPAPSANKEMSEGSEPFSIERNTTRHLCHFKLLLANFVSTLLSSNRLIEQLVELDETEKPTLEPIYGKLIESSLQYTLTVSRLVDHPLKVSAQDQGPSPKFWRAMLHRCHDIIDRINSLLPPPMFISVIHNLLSHNLPSIRRRAMELLGAKLQHQSNFFSLAENEKALLELIPDLTAIARASGPGEEAALNQQTSFFTLKLLCRLLGSSACLFFKPILELVVDTISPSTKTSTNVLASAFLCLAELIQDMGVQSLPYLPRYGANLVARLEDLHTIENHDLLLLSVVIAIHKLVETLPQFLVPYLPPIIKQVCYLSAKQPTSDKQTQLQTRLQNIRHSLATSSVPRTLVTSITKVYAEVTGIEVGKFKSSSSIGPLLAILSESFTSMSREELTIQLPALTTFFVQALDARSLLSAQKASVEDMNASEEPVVTALVSLVLKLSEASFRPLFYQLYDWATRVTDVHKERLVTFYNLTMQISEKLKGLFVSFAGHFIRNAAQVIIDTNYTKNESLPFSGPNAEANTLMLLEYVLRCLYRVCLHDNENFINKERFEALMEPLVDQLENQLGEEKTVKRRIKEMLVPLLAQMAVAASDDYLWKALHYQLLLKTRNNTPRVRLGALNALSALVEKLGEDYLALLPEAIPFLAELLEDDVQEVETEAQATIANMENILGEPLQKYF